MRTKRLVCGLRAAAIACFVVFGTGCKDEAGETPAQKYTIETDAEELQFPSDGDSKALVITTNAPWSLHTSSDVLFYTPGSGSGPASQQIVEITMPAMAADQYEDIVTTLSIKSGDLSADQVKRKFIRIIQPGRVRPDREPGIWSVVDWTNFAAAYNSGGDISGWQDQEGVVNLRGDLDFGGVKIPAVGGQSSNNAVGGGDDTAFAGQFNGNNFTIKGQLDDGNKRIVALFTRLAPAGRIENLKVDVTGASSWTDTNGHLAAVVGFTLAVGSEGGYIKNCVAQGALTHTAPASNSVRVGGIVAYCRTNVIGCESKLTIQACTNRVAGIAGAGGTATSITDCTNSGTITVAACGNKPQVGGIIGQQNGQTITGCTNSAVITVTAENGAFVGGISGQVQGSSKLGGAAAGDANSNSGAILLKYDAAVDPGTPAVAGIVGNLSAKDIPVVNCENRGSVTSDVPADKAATLMVGGIAGQVTAVSPITGCVNAAGAIVRAGHNVGGIVGKATAAAPLTNCTNSGTVDASDRAVAGFVGGIIGNKGSAVLSACTNGGTVMGAPGTESNAVGVAK